MITDAIINLFCWIGGVLTGLFGFTVPTWLVSCAGSLGFYSDYAKSLPT